MRKGFLGSMLFLMGSVTWSSAQDSSAAPNPAGPDTLPPAAAQPALPEEPANPPMVSGAVPSEFTGYDDEPLWFTADYLLWWLKSGPAPGPLVTQGNIADLVPGALGQPGTTVLFGNNNLGMNPFSGMRLTGGLWLDAEHNFALEGSFFLLEKRSIHFAASSDATGSPIIARPFTDPVFGQLSEATSIPGLFAGTTSVSAATRLLGWEANLAYSAYRSQSLRWDIIGGFRTLDLNESLVINDNLTPLTPGILTLQGNPVDPPSTLSDFDSFHTANHFYGGQLGSRLDWRTGRFHVNVLGKLALGATQQIVTIAGATTVTNPATGTTLVPGGILAQPTNIGEQLRNQFSVVPEVGLNFGYQLTPWLEARIGYSFLYWSSVARPGNQVDHTVNTGLIPSDPGFGGPVTTANPILPFRTTDFWAQGINAGLTFRY